MEKMEKVEKMEKMKKVEKMEKVEKVEKVDKVEKVEKVDKVEKVEKVDCSPRRQISFKRKSLKQLLSRRSTVDDLQARGIFKNAAVFGCALAKQTLDKVVRHLVLG